VVAVSLKRKTSRGFSPDRALIDDGLAGYHLAHSARADLYRRLGKRAEARASYERALALTHQEPERRFLERRLSALADPSP